MPQVKVWNDNVHPHTEKFKGEMITIPPKGYVEMDYMEAVDFAGQFKSPKMLGTGAPDPTGFKMIRVESPVTPIFREENKDVVTGKTFATPEELANYMRSFAAANPDLLVKNPELDTAGDKVSISKTDLEAMMARIAALETAQSEKRGPGRPKKQA